MKKTSNSLRILIPLFTAARLLITTAYRMVYPLLPAFQEGLGVSLEALSRALAGRSAAAALAPFLASLADSRGRKTGMLVGLALFIAGTATVVFWPTFFGFVLAMILSGLGKYAFDPAMQAYIGDRVPYQRRGFALTLTELAWSGSFVVGIPLVSWLIARSDWVAPFPLFAILGLLFVGLFLLLVPKDDLEQRAANIGLSANLKNVFASNAALMGLSFTLFFSAANESINLVFGVWMKASFNLQLTALGFTAAVIGIAEIGGEGLVAALVDRWGKRRAVLWGIGLNSVAALLMPFLGGSLVGAVFVLFLLYITFEFAFVASIPLMTEVLPSSRATLMSLNIAAASLGRAASSLLAPILYALSFDWNIAATILFNALAALALSRLRLVADGD